MNPTDGDNEQWELFKIKYKKNYRAENEAYRKKIFMDNLKKIRQHNVRYERGEETYMKGVNQFSDMTSEEFAEQMYGLRIPRENNTYVCEQYSPDPTVELPENLDWRQRGAVTPVKRQGLCGSCWAFSAVGCVEGAWYLKTKQLVPLSVQNLIDCSMPYGNNGCHGGFMTNAFQYIINNKGIATEQSYPYEAQNLTCRYRESDKGAVISSYGTVEKGNEQQLLQALVTHGPIAVAMCVTDNFISYAQGIFTDPICGSDVESLNHGVLLVGYGSSNGLDYWLIKNSWGTGWGMEGYGMIGRNMNNMCGIATLASYVTV